MKKDWLRKQAPQAQDVADTPPASGENLPLFFKRPVPLDMERHAQAGIQSAQEYTFAAGTNSMPLNAMEFPEASKYYPIVFMQGEMPLAAAIVGLEQNNYFVTPQGQWKEGAYIPAYARKYPFVFMDLPEQKQFLLCVDEEAPHYKSTVTDGVMPFYQNGEPAELLRNALEFCTAFQGQHQFSLRFCEALRDAGLLSPTQSNAKLFNGREIHLGGFQLIDEKKFNELPDETILEFRKEGWLPFVYFALMSASNWPRLIDMAAERERRNQLN